LGLSANAYNGSSPGYVSTAYPQIARALEDLANSIPEELNLDVEKGCALATDILWKLVLAGAIVGAVGYIADWLLSGADPKKWNWYDFGRAVAVYSLRRCCMDSQWFSAIV